MIPKYLLSFLLILTFYPSSIICQVRYVNIEPDIVLEDVHHLPLDLDEDGTDDFIIFHDTSLGNFPNEGSEINCIQYLNGNHILGIQQGHFFPKVLNFNKELNAEQELWGDFEDNLVLYVWALINGQKKYWGYWVGLTGDHFVGIRFMKEGSWHYGWIRLQIAYDGSYMIFKDYAYQEAPDAGILSGEGIPVKAVENPTVESCENASAPDKLKVKFKAVKDELPIKAYRVFFVKQTDTAIFDKQCALEVPPEYYINVFPGHNEYALQPGAHFSDYTGQSILPACNYVAYVLSIGKCIVGNECSLSNVSNPFCLENSTVIENKPNLSKLMFLNQGGAFLIKNPEYLKIRKVQVYDMSGSLIRSGDFLANNTFVIRLSQGAYIARIQFENNTSFSKLFIIK